MTGPGPRGPRAAWGHRLPLALAKLPLLLVLVVLFGSVGSGIALADPSDQPGGTSGILDTPELDALQAQAAEVQTTLQDRQAAVADVLTRLREAERIAVVSASARHEADDTLAARQDALSGYSAAIYVDGSAPDELRMLLDGQGAGDVVAALGYLDAVRSYHQGGLAAAARARADAAAAEQAANVAVDRVRAEAAVLQDEAARVEQAASDVTDQLTAALSRVNEQLAELQAAQVQVNAETAARWSTYLAQLAAAGATPPPVATLMDPARSLPAGLVPIGASNGGANPGAAQLPRQPSSLLVLSDEAVRAVSAGLNALGLPYAPGTAAESYDCGTLIQAAFGSVGISLPATATELWAALPPVAPVDSLPGDLVFLGNPESGISHVGIALDPQTMLAADAQAGAVIIRRIPAEQVIGFARPVLPPGAPREVPAADPTALPMSCGATVYPASYGGDRAWGGYPNGLIPANALCPIGVGEHLLRCDASAAWIALSRAFEEQFGRALCMTDSYRSFGSQVTLYGQKPALAAVPGTSNHGWALAVDLCGGVQTFGTAEYVWMQANAGRFGWIHPTWADPGNGREEPWHWEYAGG